MNMSGAVPTTESLSAQDYPAVYKVTKWARILTIAFALTFACGWTYMMLHPSYAHDELTFDPVLITIAILGVAVAIYGIAWALTARITLYIDRFEQHKPLVHRVLRISDIAGRRYTGSGAGYPVIVPKSGLPFSIDKAAYGLDYRFNRWFLSLPDLQKIEREKNLERIRNDPSLGATPGERIAADAARKQKLGLIGGGLTVAAVVLFYASTLVRGHLTVFVVINGLLPWASLLLLRIYRAPMVGPDSGKSGLLALPIYVPVCTLGMLAIANACLVDPKAAILAGLVAGSVLLFTLFKFLPESSSSSRRKIGLVLIFLPFAWLYAGSLLALGNRMLDGRPYQIVPTKVVDKYIHRGRSGRSYYLTVAGWNGKPDGASIRVEGDQYIEAKQGDDVCMALYPGRFGFRWMKGINCSGEDGPL